MLPWMGQGRHQGPQKEEPVQGLWVLGKGGGECGLRGEGTCGGGGDMGWDKERRVERERNMWSIGRNEGRGEVQGRGLGENGDGNIRVIQLQQEFSWVEEREGEREGVQGKGLGENWDRGIE